MGLALVSHEDLDGSPVEIPTLAYLVLKEAAIGLLDPLRKIAEEDKCRNIRVFQHRDIFDLHEFTFVRGRGCYGYLLEQITIQLRSRDYAPPVFINFDRSLEDLEDSLFCEG